MSKVLLGILCGIVFGGLSVATMIPLKMENKGSAMAAAFVNRFAIGFAIGAAELPLAGWLSGLIFGLLISLPEAIITKAWAPIMAIGAVGGTVIGLIVGARGV
jgi:hypothetical protein